MKKEKTLDFRFSVFFNARHIYGVRFKTLAIIDYFVFKFSFF